MIPPKIYPLSETAIVVEWGHRIDDALHRQVVQLNHALLKFPFEGLVETVPAYASLTVFYQPEQLTNHGASPFLQVKRHLENLLNQSAEVTFETPRLVKIPVCYDESLGYDLNEMAETKDISQENLIQLHQQKTYRVYMMGFLPGFAYLGPVDNTIACARKASPRAKVEAGSVGIAGNQTGIYPLDSPGGWQIIGRTPLRMFEPEKSNPFLLKTGDQVQFYTIDLKTFQQWPHDAAPATPPDPAAALPDVLVLKSGPYATLQDLGRPGFRASGVPLSGAIDQAAHCAANALVGNETNAASIECTMGGLQLLFQKPAVVALSGAGKGFVNKKEIPFYQPLEIAPQDVLEIRFQPPGLRTYVAVQGGFQGEKILGSQSACPLIGIGALLQKDSGLMIGRGDTIPNHQVSFPPPATSPTNAVRVMPGPEFDWMSPGSQVQFFEQPFSLSRRCDRMGSHLIAEPLALQQTREMCSTAVAPGTIQLTPGGQLILLMNDCQTTGGYPRVGQVAAVDLPRVAQLIPGETIHFQHIGPSEAEALYLAQQTGN